MPAICLSFGGVAALLSTIAPPETVAATSQLALWRDADGFDILLNWGAQNQLSLRAKGANVMGSSPEKFVGSPNWFGAVKSSTRLSP